jgi:hypothetical protein
MKALKICDKLLRFVLLHRNVFWKLQATFRAWRSAGNSIPSARTVVDFLFKVQNKFFC